MDPYILAAIFLNSAILGSRESTVLPSVSRTSGAGRWAAHMPSSAPGHCHCFQTKSPNGPKYLTTSTPQLPLKISKTPSNRDHEALKRATWGGAAGIGYLGFPN